MANNYKIWTVLICTATGDHIAQNYIGSDAQRRAQRTYDALCPVAGAGLNYVELRHGGKFGLLAAHKALGEHNPKKD